MIKLRLLAVSLFCFSFQPLWAVSALAPALPDLMLPAETQDQPAAPVAAAETATPVPAPSAPQKSRAAKKRSSVPAVTNTVSKVNTEEISVENLLPPSAQPLTLAQAPASAPISAPAETTMMPEALPASVPADTVSAPSLPAQPVSAVPAAEEAVLVPAVPVQEAAAAPKEPLVQFNPPTDRDPTLSPDDALLLKHREEERLRALEAERQRKLEEERRRLAELERQRRLELERLRDPSREIRGRIRVSGIIGQEAFIGNRIYSVGQTILGARIVEVRPDSVVFVYKGQRFIKNVDLK